MTKPRKKFRQMSLPKKESLILRRKLAILEVKTYDEYLASNHWAKLRQRLIEPECWACGSDKRLCLHHSTYASLGMEKAGDLYTLCNPCHRSLHYMAVRTGSLIPSKKKPAKKPPKLGIASKKQIKQVSSRNKDMGSLRDRTRIGR